VREDEILRQQRRAPILAFPGVFLFADLACSCVMLMLGDALQVLDEWMGRVFE
jgi:hypothetical protein